ncbi:hypothetical protein [Pyxidicoccus xibeiensis]|uniref:hypothetical protein n=1 Tax=Pyxidicoccus xibeiensis TaxID=2906759 RepID=UPI0020A7AA8D|nr:hypothetical protein [Pyxidicoccus xibeiensis]MCP3142271.1 hypothetical protein [Pyxidicoccus xibeiensis]
MGEIALEEWQLLAESPVPGWQVVEQLARAASTVSEGARLLVFEPTGSKTYRISYSASAPFEWSGSLEELVRKALRREGFVGLTIRSPEVLSSGLRHYRRVQGRVLNGDGLASELGGRLLELEEFLEGAHLLMLAGHDGDPVFLLAGVEE